MALRLISKAGEAAPEESNESYLGYGIRNAAKVLPNAYAAARSGFGAGNALNKYLKESNAPEFLKTAQRYGLPSHEQALEEPKHLIQNAVRSAKNPLHDLISPSINQSIESAAEPTSNYFTESRPEDYPAELALNTAGAAGLGYATGGASGVLHSLLGVGGAMAGSHALGAAGKHAGSYYGYPETGEALGQFVGGAAGAVIPGAIANRASKKLSPKILAAESEAESARMGVLEAQNKALQKQHAMEKLMLSEEQAQATKAQERRYKDAALAIEKEKSQFKQDQKDRIIQIKKEIALKEAETVNLSKIQKEEYHKAREAYSGEKGPADKLLRSLNEAAENLSGMSESDQGKIRNVARDVEADIRHGEYSVKAAESTYRNINDQIYNRDTSPMARVHLKEMKAALENHILENGNPKYVAAWKMGNETTAKLKEAQGIGPKGRRGPKPAKSTDQLYEELSNIQKEKFPAEREYALKEQLALEKQSLNELKTDHTLKAMEQKQAQSAMGDKLKDVFKEESQKSLEQFGAYMEEAGKAGIIDSTALAGVAFFAQTLGLNKSLLVGGTYGLAKAGLYESNIVRYAFKNHPALYNEYAASFKRAMVGDFPKAIKIIGHASEKMEQPQPQGEKKKKLRLLATTA